LRGRLGVTHGKRLKFSGGLPILNGAAMLSRRREWKDEGLCRMKKQICFAGFAERELDALQPALAALGGAWTCVFSPDAAAARAVLLTAPFDAAVVNLRPDGICDSALLQEAATQHPRMLRFVLGEVGDRDLMVNCIGAAHQFISRPWKAPELISIIERSLALDAWLSNDNLRSFVPRLGKLPGLPATYFEVLKKTESPNATVESVAEVIARDPTLTARLLQMVNSPACGLAEKITNPAEAVSMLGLDVIKSLVLCLQVFAQSAPAPAAGLSLERLWRQSFLVAKMAAKIVLRHNGNEHLAGEAYTAGLLHNVGQIVLAASLSTQYALVIEAARKQKRPLREVELEQLGVTNNQVGAYLLGLWGLPLPLLEATALHDTPSLATTVEFSILTAVHVAKVLAQEDDSRGQGPPLPKLDGAYLAALDLPAKTEAWRKILAAAPPERPNPRASASSHAPSATRGEEPGARPFPKLLFAVAMAAIVVAVAAVRRNPPPARQSGPAAVEASATGEETNTAPVSTNATAFDSIKIQGIVFNSGHPVAIINGKTLDVGGRVNGAEVVSIEPSTVVLACQGEQRTFRLK